jgi:hypothetical protein
VDWSVHLNPAKCTKESACSNFGRTLIEFNNMTAKERIIDAILEIELVMFITINPQKTGCYQKYPDSFRLHRRAQFLPWSLETLGSYLEDLRDAQDINNNLIRLRYARMQSLIPRQNASPVIDEIVRLKMYWQNEVYQKYPAVMNDARQITKEDKTAVMRSFETLFRGELETYSNRTLELLYADLLNKLQQGVNLSEEVYECLVRDSGYPSLAEAERRFLQHLGQ